MKYILVFLADWANGLFAVLLTSYVTGIQAEWWHFLIGVIFSHFPDLDALPELWRRGKVSANVDHPYDHRDGLHYPIVLLSIGIGLYAMIPYWGFIFFIVTALHLFNDFYGTGWGIKLFWPVSNSNFKLLGRRVNRLRVLLETSDDWSHLPDNERRLRLIVSWQAEELPMYIKRWGVDGWIEEYYLKFNWINAVEYCLFGIALIATLWYLL
jgi:hypothetical protein